MWNPLSVDWNYLKLSNRMWFENHVGFTITMFYFPCTKPILTEYKPRLRYIFDRAIFNNTLYDIKEVMSDMIFPNSYEIGYKRTLDKIDDVTPVISAVMAEKDLEKTVIDIVGILRDTGVDKTFQRLLQTETV